MILKVSNDLRHFFKFEKLFVLASNTMQCTKFWYHVWYTYRYFILFVFYKKFNVDKFLFVLNTVYLNEIEFIKHKIGNENKCLARVFLLYDTIHDVGFPEKTWLCMIYDS